MKLFFAIWLTVFLSLAMTVGQGKLLNFPVLQAITALWFQGGLAFFLIRGLQRLVHRNHSE